jgi:hypothetical protein
MHTNNLIAVLLLFVIFYLILNKKNKENLYIYPNCNHIKPFTNKYRESYYDFNISSGFDCYKRCLDNVDCQYVGVGFDCYNYCFDNLGKKQNNTLEDYNQ